MALAAHVGLREETIHSLAWVCLIAAGCGLLVGLACRLSAILAWLFHFMRSQKRRVRVLWRG